MENLISYDNETRVFHLKNNCLSYIFKIDRYGKPESLYYGKRIKNYTGTAAYPEVERSFEAVPGEEDSRNFSYGVLLQEIASYGHGDYREPSVTIESSNYEKLLDPVYRSHEIKWGKAPLTGLPQTYGNKEEVQTLRVELEDSLTGTIMILVYSIFKSYPIITRSLKIVNDGKEPLILHRVMSMNLDLPMDEYDLIHSSGRYANERMSTREAVMPGIKVLDSKRGASGHHENPFFALGKKETSEILGFSLVYSGNHKSLLQKDPYDQLRIQMGINDFGFQWQLGLGEVFETPEVVMAYSDNTTGQLSNIYQEFYAEHLIRGSYKKRERPVLMNNWEATYFQFDEEKILGLAAKGAELGIELFVLDDGWFDGRNDDRSSLGDWYADTLKLPGGLKSLSEKIHSLGMQFGLWVEPEMISERSRLFEEHPEWVVQSKQYQKSKSRDQYVLDFSDKEVIDYLYGILAGLIRENNLDYLKWDMNRNITEPYSGSLPKEHQGEFMHRYILGVYELLERLTQEFPKLLIESCSGGGGRFDAGMLYYTPQIWASDNTDAIDRLKIQYGTTLCYPPSAMGAHVSAVPNHQNGRFTNLATRYAVATMGVLGYEMDLFSLSQDELELVRKQIRFYKENRWLYQYGKLVWLSEAEDNLVAWMNLSEDKEKAVLTYVNKLSSAAAPLQRLKLKGLNPETQYMLTVDETMFDVLEPEFLRQARAAVQDGFFAVPHYGDELMNIGFYLDPYLIADFQSRRIVIQKV